MWPKVAVSSHLLNKSLIENLIFCAVSCILQTTGVKVSVSPVKKYYKMCKREYITGVDHFFLKKARINSCSLKSNCYCDCFQSLPEQWKSNSSIVRTISVFHFNNIYNEKLNSVLLWTFPEVDTSRDASGNKT